MPKVRVMIRLSQPYIDQETIDAVTQVLRSGNLVQGRNAVRLEEELARVNNTAHAIVFNSGTAALHTALYALGITRGDEVITTPFSFVATANSILMCGAKPVFVDIAEDTYLLDINLIEEKITEKTKAIMSVDLYGQPCDYDALKEIAKRHNLFLIADACQAIGATYNNAPIGSIADVTCFSLYATKNVMMGEGGALTTNNSELAKIARRFKHHGQDVDTPYTYFQLGYNYRPTDITAAIGLQQIKNLDEWTKKRQENATKLTRGLRDIKGLITPITAPNRTHVFHQYTIRLTEQFPLSRDELQMYLLEEEIKTTVYYPSILPLHKHLRDFVHYKKGDLPIAEKVTKQVLSLPVHPLLGDADLKQITQAIRSVT